MVIRAYAKSVDVFMIFLNFFSLKGGGALSLGLTEGM